MQRTLWRVTGSVLGVLALAVPIAACSSSSDSSSKGASVALTLTDYKIAESPESTPAGKITFKATNNGSFVHEVLIVKADSPAALPLDSEGIVDEDALGDAIAGEISDINPGKVKSETLDLAAGKYVLLCNRVDGTMSHFKEGMVTTFTVT